MPHVHLNLQETFQHFILYMPLRIKTAIKEEVSKPVEEKMVLIKRASIHSCIHLNDLYLFVEFVVSHIVLSIK